MHPRAEWNTPRPPGGAPERSLWLAVGGVAAGLAIVFSSVNVLTVLARETETQTHTYEQDVSRLVIDASTGDVTVRASDDGAVHVERHLSWSFRKPRIEERFVGDTLRLGVDGCALAFVGCEIDYVVMAPGDVDLVAETGSGDLIVQDLTGDVRASTGSGDVELSDVGGTGAMVDARSGSGDVRVHRMSGEMVLRTGSGDIWGVGLEAASVNAQTGSGDINLDYTDAPRSVTARTGSGDARLTVPPSESYQLLVDTGSGDEQVNVSNDLRAERVITISTGSGDVVVNHAGG